MTFDDDGSLQGAGALPRVQGAGGGGGKSGGGSASSAPDTLFSTATVRLVDLLGEGEIVGVRGGLKGVYLNDVPVQNEDGSFNLKGLTAEFRVGTPDQPYMAGYPDVQTPRNVGIKVNAATPVTASITDTDVDRLRVTIQVPSLFLAKSDGSVRANSVSYRVEARYSGGPWVNALGDQTITGKTTSGYFRSHEIALPTNPSGASAPWQVRVTRLSPDTDDFNNSQAKFTNQSDLVFYSTTSIVDARFGYPHSAMVGLTAQASSFGSSVPGRTYLVDGVMMPIPSNYDPVARTYSGVWDGTFKEGFSNNPAWALNLILRNDRFGLGEFIDTAAIDKWSLYEIGRYCDVPVSDGKGGQEPRYVFNGAISTQQEAFELLQLIAQVFRGTVYWSSGTVTAAQDRPADPVLLVTEANVIDGEFSYASSGRRARHTVAIVAWNDPDNLYKQTLEVVEDSDGVARYGYNPTKIDLLGCTSRGQAHRTGLWTLFTELHQTQVLTYRAGLDHAVIRPGDIVAVQDPQISNLDLSGRLKAGSTATRLVLDRPVTFTSGAAYSISVVMPDGAVQERAIATGAGPTETVDLASALPQAPDPAAVWLIAGPVEPQLFRIVSIREEEPHIYAVAALLHEPGKYATIDDGAAFEPSVISEFPTIVLPPTNLTVRESQYTELGQPKQAITLSWTPGQPFNSVAYYVTVIRPSGATVTTRTASQSIDFMDAEVGDWTFVVTAIGLNGKNSLPAQTTYTLAGWAGQAPTMVAGLSVKGGGSTFSGRSCTVTWANQIAATVPPYPVRNVVYIFDASTQALVHREVLTAGVTEWTYDYFLNVNEGGPRRQFRVGVTAYSAAGDEGPPSYLTVSNPAPEIIVPMLGSTSEVLFVDLPKVADADFAGYLVWVSETPNINPLTAPNYDVAGNSFPYRGVADKTYYVLAAAYDAFSKNPADLNVSAEQSKKLTIQLFDPSAPAIPGQPTLTSNVAETAPDGTVTSRITIGWPAVTSSNLGRYEVFVAEGNNPADSAYVGERFVTGTSTVFAGLMPGRVYSFKLRSVSQNNFAVSGMSPVLVVTAAANTTPPGAPTVFTVTPSFEAANLSWTNPTNKDLLGIEVWAGATNVQANATLLKVVPYPAAFYRDVLGTSATKFYWIRAVNTSDYKSGFVGPQSATSPLLQAGQMAADIAESTAVAAGLATNKVVTALPAAKTHDYVTFQGKLYRWDATAGKYTAEVVAADISGKISAAQIDTINGDQIRGTVAAANLAGIEAGKITGTMRDDQLAGIAAAKVAGQLTNATLSATKIFDKITAGQIEGITAAQLTTKITATNIADGAISTPLLAAGAVQAANISAGAITAGKLTLSDPSNMVLNGSFNINGTPSSEGWSLGAGSVVEGGLPANDPGGPQRLRSTGRDQAFSNQIACTAGDVIYVSAMNANLSNYTANLYIVFYEAGSSNPAFASVASRPAQAGTWQRMEGRATCPAGKQSFNVLLQTDRPSNPGDGSNCYWGKVQARRASSAELIVDGAIIARSIATDAIEASKIKAGAVTAGKLAVDAVTADTIAANAIVAGKIQSGAVETRHMTAGTINASVLVGQSITAGLLAANAVTAEKISANAVTAGKLLLTDMSNMLRNGDFGGAGAASSEGWSIGTNTQSFIDTAGPDDSGGYHRLRSDFRDQAISHVIACTVGDQFYLSAMVNQQHSSVAQLLVRFIDAQGTEKSFPAAASTTVKNSWVRLEGRVTAPPGATQFQVFLQNERSGGEAGLCYWGRVQCRRASSAQMIVDGAITTDKLTANAVTAGKIASNQITTAHIQAGAVKADQIDAGAISADKLGIGLNTGNLIWNSDQALDGWYQHGDSYNTIGLNSEWAVTGTNAIVTFSAGAPRSGAADFVVLLAPTSSNSKTANFPVQAGKTYEYSVYLSAHRCSAFANMYWVRADGSYISENSSLNITNVQAKGAPNDTWRAKVRAMAPSDATAVVLRFVMHQQNANDGYVFASGFYFGICDPKATAWSEYAPQSRTVITGGQIATDSIHANRIQARTITGDRIVAGTIGTEQINADQLKARIIDTDGLQASKIVVGGTRLNNWVSSTNNTQINGGAIAANSIEASRIRVGARGFNLVGISFYSERDANENLTNVFCWTGGHVLWVDDNGVSQATQINNGNLTRVGYDGGFWYVIWVKGSTQFLFEKDTWGSHVNQQDRVLIATVSGITGISLLVGSTIIDGTRITTGSISADKIAANQIQTRHMSANSISGDRIQVGTMSADRITTGTITAGKTIFVGDDRFMLDSDTQMIRIRNRFNGTEQVSIGAVGKFYGNNNDFGIIIRDHNNVELFRVAGGYARMTGAIIDAASIGSAQIGDLQVTNAKIGDLQVGNTKIADFAVSTITAASGGGRDISTNTVSRSGNSKFLILAFFNGNSNLGSTAGPGAFSISRNGTQLTSVSASFALFKPDSGNLQYYLNSMCIGVIDQPGAGTVSYSCFHSNGQGVGGVTIVAMELAK